MEAPNSLSNRWIATVASIWIQCICGSSYTFGIYSSALKSSQHYDQSTLDTVSVSKDIGATAGILAGLLYSAIVSDNRRRSAFSGPWVVLAVGAVQCFIGYIFIWATVSGIIHRPPVPVMCFFMFLAVHAQVFFNTANVVSGVHNFQLYGGTIVGILKGFLGLSGAVLIQFSNTLCNGDPRNYLLMLAILPTLVTLLVMCFVVIDKAEIGNELKHLNSFSTLALIISLYLTLLIILDNLFTLSIWVRIFTFILLLILLASPLRIAIRARKEDYDKKSSSTFSFETTLSKQHNEDDSLEYHQLPSEEDKDHQLMIVSDNQSMNIIQAISTINFWLLFFAMICGMGSGLATINNMNQLGQSLGYKTVEINAFVSLWSIWNFLGRLGAGYASDFLLRVSGWARPLLMAIGLLTMSLGHIIIAAGFHGNLYVGSVIVGICYGTQWSLMPTITSEIFGLQHMGTIYNTITMAGPIGSYILSVRIIGYIYDREASAIDNFCSGKHCFMTSFLIMAAVAFLGFLVAIVLFFRTRRFYQLLVQKRAVQVFQSSERMNA